MDPFSRPARASRLVSGGFCFFALVLFLFPPPIPFLVSLLLTCCCLVYPPAPPPTGNVFSTNKRLIEHAHHRNSCFVLVKAAWHCMHDESSTASVSPRVLGTSREPHIGVKRRRMVYTSTCFSHVYNNTRLLLLEKNACTSFVSLDVVLVFRTADNSSIKHKI